MIKIFLIKEKIEIKTELILNLNTIEKVKKFTDTATKFNSDIDILRDRYVIDGKSALGIYTLDLTKPVNVRINSDDQAEIVRFNVRMEEFIP